MPPLIIREIQPKDNQQIAALIRTVLVAMGVPKVGTAYEDEALDRMYETYNQTNCAYFLVVVNGEIIGGAGIAPLAAYQGNVCELQKMYFLDQARGKGYGAQMMHTCLTFAKSKGYEHCYLETMPYMEDARRLYTKSGFESLEKPLGNTGHYNCTRWMIKTL
jgi:putative acetyltransferase